MKKITSIALIIFMVMILPVTQTQAAKKKTLNKSKVTLVEGKTIQLKIKNNKNKIVWLSSNKKVTMVTKKGKVIAKKKGFAKVTAKIGKKKYVCKVTVKSRITSISLTQTALVMEKGSQTALNISVKPSKEINKVKWYSSDESIAKVSNGIVSALRVGKCTIKATLGGKSAVCTLQVSETYGNVSGKITWLYNSYRGNVADTDAKVILVSTSCTASEVPNLSSYIDWLLPSTINQTLNKFGIYEVKVDGTGTFTFNNIPTGEYKIFVMSNKTTNGEAFKDKRAYMLAIQNSVKKYINETNADFLSQIVGYNKYTISTVNVVKNQTVIFSYDFGITFI